MMRQLLPLLLAVMALIQGCAPAMVGGGAAAGALAAHDRRTLGTVIDDQRIEFEALNAMHNEPMLEEKAHIGVVSYNGVVLLAGEAPTSEAASRAASLVRKIPEVRRVYNELAIAEPASAKTRASDTLITARVKTRLFKINDIEGFDPTRVKVVTKRGIVYLMGLVTRTEADAVTEIARTSKGVKKVVRLFEYVEGSQG